MRPSALLALYPKRWRARYGAELATLIDVRPSRASAVLDLLLGAIDAHLHPELVRASSPIPESQWRIADMAQDPRTMRARRVASARYGFRWHLPIYVIANTGYVLVWLLNGEGFFWPVYPIFFWGIGLFAHYMGAYRTNGGGWIERETQKILDQENRRGASAAPPPTDR